MSLKDFRQYLRRHHYQLEFAEILTNQGSVLIAGSVRKKNGFMKFEEVTLTISCN